MPATRSELDAIYKAVSRVTTVGRFWIRSTARQPVITHARAVAAEVMHRRGMGWKRIGKEINRSHSSVIELVQAHKGRRLFKQDVAKVSETLDAQKRTEAA